MLKYVLYLSICKLLTCILLLSLLLANITDLVGPRRKLDLAFGGYEEEVTVADDRTPEPLYVDP